MTCTGTSQTSLLVTGVYRSSLISHPESPQRTDNSCKARDSLFLVLANVMESGKSAHSMSGCCGDRVQALPTTECYGNFSSRTKSICLLTLSEADYALRVQDCNAFGSYLDLVIAAYPDRIGTQPSRARALSAFSCIFQTPQTYPSTVSVPLPTESSVLPVPTDITPQSAKQLAFVINNPTGGYKVPSLIGLYLSAPYLHDGGVAAGPEALTQDDSSERFRVGNGEQLGVAGTLLRFIQPDPDASLRLLLDRDLRETAIAANRANLDLQQANVDISGHTY